MTYQITQTPLLLHVLGPQGSGKGTQVALLNEALDAPLPVITMGEIFRAEIVSGTERGLKIKAILDPGGKVTDELWEPVIRDYLPNVDLMRGVILDGVVRALDQFKAFERIRTELNLPEPYVLAISVPEEESVKRLLLRGRHDDTEEGIRRRLTWSREEVQPLIDHYRELDRTIDVDGFGSIEEIHTRVIDGLVAANILTHLSS
jgi:adenylate kinase